MSWLKTLSFTTVSFILSGAASTYAAEYPVGEPQLRHGMEIAAVYLQPIEMEPEGMMTPAAESDIHLEADIHATAENRNGFAEGEWLPNLHVEYVLTKLDDRQEASGAFMPMVASDGPHYGANIKLSARESTDCNSRSIQSPMRKLTSDAMSTKRPASHLGPTISPSSTNSPSPARARKAATDTRGAVGICLTRINPRQLAAVS